VKNIVIKYAFLQGMLIPYSSQNGFIYLSAPYLLIPASTPPNPCMLIAPVPKPAHSLRDSGCVRDGDACHGGDRGGGGVCDHSRDARAFSVVVCLLFVTCSVALLAGRGLLFEKKLEGALLSIAMCCQPSALRGHCDRSQFGAVMPPFALAFIPCSQCYHLCSRSFSAVLL
jgi:hypothetical protein